MFRKYRCSEIFALNNDGNEILPICSKFFVRFGCKSIQEMFVGMCWEIVSSGNVLGDGEFRGNVLGDGEFRGNVLGDGEFCGNVLEDSSMEMYREMESYV